MLTEISFANESNWMKDLLRFPRKPELPPQDGSPSNGVPPEPESVMNNIMSAIDASGEEAIDDSRLQDIVEAVDDAANATGRQIRSPSGNCSPEKMKLMREHLLAEARKRKAVNSVIQELVRKRKARRETVGQDDVYITLLKDLEHRDESLRDIVRLIEPGAISRTGTIVSSSSQRPRTRTRSFSGNATAADVEMSGQNRADTKVEYVANAHVGTWLWWLGFDINGRWVWPQKSRMSRYWLQSREYAMVLKEQRAALSSQVMFAQLAIVQS